MASRAAAAVVVARDMRERGSNGPIDLGPMPKLQWVEVFDQLDLPEPQRIPVPRLFQRGQEQSGKLTQDAVKLWLSRGLARKVTAVHIGSLEAAASRVQGGTPRIAPQWTLLPFDDTIRESPFVDGAVVVICCNGDRLMPHVASKLPVKLSRKDAVMMKLTNAAEGGEALWRSARSRVRVVAALSRVGRGSSSDGHDAHGDGEVSDNAGDGTGRPKRRLTPPKLSFRMSSQTRQDEPSSSSGPRPRAEVVVPKVPLWKLLGASATQVQEAGYTVNDQDLAFVSEETPSAMAPTELMLSEQHELDRQLSVMNCQAEPIPSSWQNCGVQAEMREVSVQVSDSLGQGPPGGAPARRDACTSTGPELLLDAGPGLGSGASGGAEAQARPPKSSSSPSLLWSMLFACAPARPLCLAGAGHDDEDGEGAPMVQKVV